VTIIGQSKGNRSGGRPKRRWEDNIKMELTKLECKDMGSIHLAQDRDRCLVVTNPLMKFPVP
jgi:hypothetical protein